jgi:hypothetical protein
MSRTWNSDLLFNDVSLIRRQKQFWYILLKQFKGQVANWFQWTFECVLRVLRRVLKKIGTQRFTLHEHCSVRASFTRVVLKTHYTVEEPAHCPRHSAKHNSIYKVHRVSGFTAQRRRTSKKQNFKASPLVGTFTFPCCGCRITCTSHNSRAV